VADVYDGAPLFITAILAIMPKFPLVVVFLKIVYVFYGALILLNFSILFNILAIASIFFGTIFALYENKIKRLMAFSAISHMGYVLLALNLYIVDGFIVIVFYMIVYVFLSIYFFSLLIAFWQSSCGRSIDFLSDFLTVRNPFLIANFVVAFLSMAGVPPFAGFFAK
jgi:NADH-quinone oxidoreductase subunit N